MAGNLLFIRMRNKLPERAFLVLAAVFGVLFAAVTPPLHAPDEWNHFYRAYHISAGHPIGELDETGLVGGWVPADVVVMEKSLFFNIPYSPERKEDILYHSAEEDSERWHLNAENRAGRLSVMRSLASSGLSGEYRGEIFMGFPNTAAYFPTVYLPQALGIAVGRALGAGAFWLIYFGRAANLAAWIGLTYLAIRLTPIGKFAFLFLALLPTSIFQAASLSADAFTNASAYLFTALVFRAAFKEERRVDAWERTVIFVMALVACVGKFYFFLPALVFIIPAKRLGLRRAYAAYAVALYAAVAAAGALWKLVVSDISVPLMPGADPGAQAGHMLAHPLEFLAMALRSFSVQWAEYLMGFTGNLSHFWLAVPLWASAVLMLGVLFAALALEEGGSPDVRPRARAVAAIAVASSIMLIAAIEYLYFTEVRAPLLAGMQGRHLIPLAPAAALLVIRRRSLLSTSSAAVRMGVPIYLALSLACALAFTALSHYGIGGLGGLGGY